MNVKEVRPELAIALVGLLAGAWFGWAIASRANHTMAIQQDCAHFDSKTGEFVWGP